MKTPLLFALAGLLLVSPAQAEQAAPPKVPSDPTVFHNVAIGGGGFVTGIVFNAGQKGLVYLRTDVGGAYRLDGKARQWTPLLDWAGQTDWNLYGIESLASDPVEPRIVYAAAGTYTNAAVSTGELLRSSDFGATWGRIPLPFKFGGNENGRNNGRPQFCDACFSGEYPTRLSDNADRENPAQLTLPVDKVA